ncbi:extracellular solute-binding protein [Candidatus Bipolaricaulota bacterium]|nr:extracellular solute-binding protein [Candidatus Bipolaricaulota bacterium]
MDFFPGTLGAFRGRETGHLYGIPKDWSTYVVYYNVEMFEEAGLPTPNELFGYGKWSWPEFLEVAKKLTKDIDGDGKIDVYGFAYNFPGRWKLLPPAFGADWVPAPDKVVVDTPEFAEAIQFLADMALVHHVMPGVTELAEMSAPDWFANERAAMFIVGRWMTMKFQTLDFDWDNAPVPYHHKMYTWVDLVAYCVARESQHPDEAWELVNFLTGPTAQELVAQVGHAIPIRRSVAYSPAFLEALPEPGINNSVHLIPITTAPITVFDQWGEIWTAINRGLEPVWTGEKTAAEVLPGIQAAIDRIMAEE